MPIRISNRHSGGTSLLSSRMFVMNFVFGSPHVIPATPCVFCPFTGIEKKLIWSGIAVAFVKNAVSQNCQGPRSTNPAMIEFEFLPCACWADRIPPPYFAGSISSLLFGTRVEVKGRLSFEPALSFSNRRRRRSRSSCPCLYRLALEPREHGTPEESGSQPS